jgi:hypothetical protein
MCVLHVTSETNSFSEFLRETGFPVYKSYEKGEIPTIGKQRPYDDYGFSSAVSEREWNDFEGQIEDAKTFLITHEKTIRALLSTHDVSDIRFDFPYYCRLDEHIFMQSDYLPPEFLKIAGELKIGIELSLYPPTDEAEDSEPLAAPDAASPRRRARRYNFTDKNYISSVRLKFVKNAINSCYDV